MALIGIIMHSRHTPDSVTTAKFLLERAQATPGLFDVDKLLNCSAWARWPEMCRLLIVDAQADARAVFKMSSSGELELKEHYPEDKRFENYHEPGERTLEAIAACLPRGVLEAMTPAQETGHD